MHEFISSDDSTVFKSLVFIKNVPQIPEFNKF